MLPVAHTPSEKAFIPPEKDPILPKEAAIFADTMTGGPIGTTEEIKHLQEELQAHAGITGRALGIERPISKLPTDETEVSSGSIEAE